MSAFGPAQAAANSSRRIARRACGVAGLTFEGSDLTCAEDFRKRHCEAAVCIQVFYCSMFERSNRVVPALVESQRSE